MVEDALDSPCEVEVEANTIGLVRKPSFEEGWGRLSLSLSVELKFVDGNPKLGEKWRGWWQREKSFVSIANSFWNFWSERERDYRSEMKMDMCVGFGSVRLYAEHICSDSWGRESGIA